MLQKINNRIQGFLAWVIISLITITFMLFGIDYYLQSRHDRSIQATVNDDTIAAHDFQLNYRRALRSQSPDKMTLLEEKNLKQRVLDDLILNDVTFHAAQKNGFSINLNQANAAILQIPQFQTDGHFSSDRYIHAISNALFTPQTFEREVQQGMLINQQRFAWVGTSFILPSELNRFLTLYHQLRSYSYLILPASSFISQGTVNDDEINAYYKKNSSKFLKPEQISIEYISLFKSDLRHLVNVTDEEISQYYEENIAKTDAVKPLEELKDSIKEQLLKDKVQTKYESLLEQLTDLSYQESESLQSVAQALKLQVIKSDLFSRDGGSTDITKNPAVIHAAFSHDVLKFENNSAPVPINDDGVIVLRIKDHFPASSKALDDVKEQIKQQLQTVKAEKLAQNFGDKIVKGKHLVKSLEKHGLSWKKVTKAEREVDNALAAINELAFTLSKHKPIIASKLPNNDYIVLQLDEIIPGDLHKMDQELKTSISQQLEANEGLLEYDLYIHNLMSASKIVKY